jgi:hypothetical protein
MVSKITFVFGVKIFGYYNRPMTWTRGIHLMTAMLGVFAAAQGPATHNVPPAVRAPPSGRPFPVTFTDVAREAGLRMTFTSGNESSKKYIIEANGSGVAFLDYDNDGRQDSERGGTTCHWEH